MEFEKSITMEELVKIHEEIMAKFTQGNEPIDNAKELSEAALKTSEDTVKEIVDLISVLSKERQVEIAIKMRKMVAATYLTAVSEAIDVKQSCKANINARQTSGTKTLQIDSSLIAELKYLSDTDNCQCSEDMKRSLEKIFDILEEKFPEMDQP